MDNGNNEVRYNVFCRDCGTIWQPAEESSLWWRAMNHAKQGYLDAVAISGKTHGCIESDDSPYSVIGFDDTRRNFCYSFDSFVEAARKYLEIARDGMSDVFFEDNTKKGNTRSRAQRRLEEMARL